MATKPKRKTELSSHAAAEYIGVTINQFRRIADVVGLNAADYYTNPHYRSGPLCPLWSVADLRNLKRRKIVREAIERNAKPKRTKEEIHEEAMAKMARKYGEPANAIKDACEALFNLNRYAKHRSCSRDHREDIYSLKSEFLRLLCEQGYTASISEHYVPTAAKSCFGCDGTGYRWSGDQCFRCDGTGIFAEAGELEFIAFRFLIDGKYYSWHQPSYLVSWPLPMETGDVPTDWQPGGDEKSVMIASSEFAVAKRLIRFALGTRDRVPAMAVAC